MKSYLPELEPFVGWHPLRIFQYLDEEGPLHLCIYGLTVLGVFLFLWRTFRPRHHTEPFLSWTLLLAGVPFVVFSWRCYTLAQFVPIAIDMNSRLSDIDIRFVGAQAAYGFQFGTVVSSSLVCLHFVTRTFYPNDHNA